MTLLEWDLDACDLTELLEKLIELFVSPALAQSLDEETASHSVQFVARIAIVGKCTAHFPIDLWEPDLLDEFASYWKVITDV